MVDCGDTSIEGLVAALDDQHVVGVALRLDFKIENGTLSKHVFIWWIGQGVSIVKRGKYNATKGDVKATIQKNVNTVCDIEATSKNDLSVKNIIDQVKAACAASMDKKVGHNR